MKHHGARLVCTVETVLEDKDMKRKNNRWFDLGREYNLADFQIRLVAGAGLRFEIWTPDGLRSKEHNDSKSLAATVASKHAL